jgi:hypoxanthine-guanine phosphoribosyltransferase
MEKFKNKHILIVEGIIETGTTLKWVLDKLSFVSPKSINIAVLVRRTDK